MRSFKIFGFGLALISSLSANGQLLPNFGGERAGLSTLSFLKFDVSPVSSGMAGTSVAGPGDAFSAFANPAAISDLEYRSFAMSHSLLGADISQTYATGVFPFEDKVTHLGFSINAFNSGEMQERTEFQPQGTGRTFHLGNYSFGLSYTRRLSSQFSAAVQLKYVYEGVAEFQNSTATADIAFRYTTDIKKLQFAVMIQNFGGNSALSDIDADFPVLFNRDAEFSLNENIVPTVFKMGASMVPYESERQSLRVALQLNHPNDNAENYRLGAEYEYLKIFYLRAGLRLNVKGQAYPGFGFSLRTRLGGHPLFVDYAGNPTQHLGLQNTIGLRLSIINDQRN